MNFLSGGQSLCRLGFGTWPLGGEAVLGGINIGCPPRDRAVALAALECGLAHGITFFDTADIYGLGLAEQLLGEALAGRREQAVICTKFGNREDESGRPVADFSAAWLARSVAASLRRLCTDYLDILLLHGPADDFDWRSFDRTPFDALVRQGTLRAYGVSSKSFRGARRVIEASFGSVVEVIYNAIDRRIEAEVLPLAAANGISVIARVPLAKGFLSEGYLRQQPRFDARDHRSLIGSDEQAWMLQAARSLGFLQELPGGMAVSALRFCLSDARVSMVIPGMSTAAQVAANCMAVQLGPLPEAVRQRVAAAVPAVYPGWERPGRAASAEQADRPKTS